MSVSILGVNAYHGDAAAALLVDGVCVAAVDEERFTRIKHQAGFPQQSVKWCLKEAGIPPEELNHVAIGRHPASNAWNKIKWMLRHPPDPRFFKDRFQNAARILDLDDAIAASLDVSKDSLKATFHRVEHHRSHLASAFFCSPFEQAACLSLDGMGDFSSTMWSVGEGPRMKVMGTVSHPHSLGHYYTAFTQFLGLPHYGDEYKLMGLAAFGEPRFVDQVRKVLWLERDLQLRLGLEYFLHHTKGVAMTWEGTPVVGAMYSEKMVEEFGPARNPANEVTERDADLAASIQFVLDEVVLEMLRRLQVKTKEKAVVTAGGVALNCVTNGKIRAQTGFEDVWVQPASNDAGTALGAALWVWNEELTQERTWEMKHAFLGPGFDDSDHKKALADAGLSSVSLVEHELFGYVAGRIADGAIVGWFQGRMEFGPRALGNRSIVCDPRRSDMKDILNSRIKHRESFRPFAPSILEEKAGQWFEQDYPSPYMLMAYAVKRDKRSDIPAVTHEDGTGRLQTVSRDANRRFHDLISAFEAKTNVPILLNTSFNENEPVTCTPKEAVATFQRTKMDLLVLGNHVVERL
jgi:carbamoyltransferase